MNKAKIKKGLDTLAAGDHHLADMLGKIGYPPPRIRPAGFETFLTTIISQQISNQAAATITRRVLALMDEVTAEALLGISDTQLRDAGLSQRKLEYAQGLARAIAAGEFDPDSLRTLSDQEAIAAIVKLRGFGVWSAEVYLMVSLGRPDIFPADDLIIRASLRKLKRKRAELTAKKARELVAHWAPYRSAGSLFLWHMHHMRDSY